MLPFLTEAFGNPSGSHAESRRARRARRRRPRADRRSARRRLRRGGVHLRRHRGGQPGDRRRLGVGAPAGPDRRVAGVLGDRAPRSARPRAGRSPAVQARSSARWPAGKHGIVDLDALAEAVRPGGRTRIGDDGQQRDRDRPADRGRSPRSSGTVRRRPSSTPMRCRRCPGSTVDVVLRAGRSGRDQRAQVRRPEGGGRTPRAPGGRTVRTQLHGGGQERERRSGTHNVAGVVGCAAALAATVADRERQRRPGRRTARSSRRRSAVVGPGHLRDGPIGRDTVAGITHLRFAGVEGETLVVLLDEARRGRLRRCGLFERRGRGEPRAGGDGAVAGGGHERCPVLARARPPPPRTSTGFSTPCRPRWLGCGGEPVRVMVAMSGGVDSSVAAALVADRFGPDNVVGATLKLWGGPSDSGCCSVADVEDARRVCDRLGLVHRVFDFSAEFERDSGRPLRVRPRDWVRRPTRASSATAISSSTDCWRAHARSASTRWRRATTPGACATDRGSLPAAPGCGPPEGPVLRAGHAGPGPAGSHALADR